MPHKKDIMNKPITRQMHGFTDYAYLILAAAAPDLVGFERDEKAALLAKIMSSAVAGSSFFTRAEWGFYRIIPFKAHLMLDVAAGVFAASAPWLFGFSRNKSARNTFLAMGAFGIMAGLLTENKEMTSLK